MNVTKRLIAQLAIWAIPSVITAAVAIIAGGIDITFKSANQNPESLFNELRQLRRERQELNDKLYKEKMEIQKSKAKSGVPN